MDQTSVLRRAGGIVAEAVTLRGRGDRVMQGVVSRPAVMRPGGRVLVILGKAGVGDVWRWLADALASRGVVVLRFDPAIREQPGDAPVDLAMPEYFRSVQDGAFIDDTEDAVRWALRTYGVTDVTVLGVCGTCSSVLLAAAALGRAVAGLILVTPAVLYSSQGREMRDQDAQTLSRSYSARIFSLAAYRQFFTGQSDYRAILACLTWLVRRPLALARRGVTKLDRRPRPSHPAFNWRFWEGFRAVMASGTPVLSLLAEIDSETVDFTTEFQAPVLDRDREYARLCRVEVLPETDHWISTEAGRRLAFSAILDWTRSLATHAPERTAAAS